jgi:hypothetical protein
MTVSRDSIKPTVHQIKAYRVAHYCSLVDALRECMHQNIQAAFAEATTPEERTLINEYIYDNRERLFPDLDLVAKRNSND